MIQFSLPYNVSVKPGTSNIESLMAVVGYVPNVMPADESFAADMYRIYSSGYSMTTKQVDVCMRILGKYRSELIALGLDANEYDRVISGRICSREPRQSINFPTEIRYAGQNVLAIRSKFNAQLVKAIKRLDTPQGLTHERTFFDSSSKLWYVHVTKQNLDLTMKLIKDFKMNFDDGVVAFLAQCTDAKVMPSEVQVQGDQVNIIVRDNLLLHFWLTNHIRWSEDV